MRAMTARVRPLIVLIALFSTIATARAEEAVTTPDHALGLPDRWDDSPVSVSALAAAGPQVFGHIVGVEAAYAPIPWVYVSALAGEDQAGVIAGGGVHVRALFGGPAALSAGARLLHTGARSDATSEHPLFGSTTNTSYTYDPATWATGELALEFRSQDGIEVKLLADVGGALAGGTYTFTRTVVDTGLFGSGNSTMSHGDGSPIGPQVFVGVAVGFSPHL
jgi:hypothetical protein